MSKNNPLDSIHMSILEIIGRKLLTTMILKMYIDIKV